MFIEYYEKYSTEDSASNIPERKKLFSYGW